MSERCQKVVWKVCGRCLEGVWKVPGRCLEGVWNMSGKCLEDVWMVSDGLNRMRYTETANGTAIDTKKVTVVTRS